MQYIHAWDIFDGNMRLESIHFGKIKKLCLYLDWELTTYRIYENVTILRPYEDCDHFRGVDRKTLFLSICFA